MAESERKLCEVLRPLIPFALAFSGGADSTLLAAFTVRHFGPGSIRLIHVDTGMEPGGERVRAEQTARALGVKITVLEVNMVADPRVRANGPRRCYYCKRKMLKAVGRELARAGITVLCDGANADDSGDYRPGMTAADELGVKHPLLDAGFGKRQIRLAARRLGLDQWHLPASACLASRIQCGTALEEAVLARVRRAELLLAEQYHFPGSRVRVLPGNTAKVEVTTIYLPRLIRLADAILPRLRLLGFQDVQIDPAGYRRGSMNIRPDEENRVVKTPHFPSAALDKPQSE